MLESHGPIGRVDRSKKITIIGAGISGLVMGYYLKKAGLQFEILEKEDHVGGKIGTTQTPYGLAEKAANAVFTNDDVLELLDELNLSYSAASKKLKKFVWRNNQAKSPPFFKSEIFGILTRLFKKIPTDKNITIYDFFSPLMGVKVSSEVLAPALAGIYATDIKNLHLDSIFKTDRLKNMSYLKFFLALKAKRKSSKSKASSVSFAGGMQGLINALKNDLKEYIKIQNEVTELNENSIICTDAHEASELLSTVMPKISAELKNIQYTQTTTATVITKNKIPFLTNSFGIVFRPSDESVNSLGILSNSEIFPNRVEKDHHSYTFIIKGVDTVEQKINQDIKRILNHENFIEKASQTQITPWKKAIPLYDQKRYDSILKIRTEMIKENKNYVLFGNYVDGISIREIISMAKEFSQKIGI